MSAAREVVEVVARALVDDPDAVRVTETDHRGTAVIELFVAGTLGELALATRNRLDQLVSDEDAHKAMLAELERQHDDLAHGGDTLPTSDELAAEVEQYLRTQDSELDESGTDDPNDDADDEDAG